MVDTIKLQHPPHLCFLYAGGNAADLGLYSYRPTERDSKLAASITSMDVAFIHSFIHAIIITLPIACPLSGMYMHVPEGASDSPSIPAYSVDKIYSP